MADVSVRGVPDEVVARLQQQATAEGVSFSEWVRQALADRASLATVGELAARRGALSDAAQDRDAFDAFYERRLRRRRA